MPSPPARRRIPSARPTADAAGGKPDGHVRDRSTTPSSEPTARRPASTRAQPPAVLPPPHARRGEAWRAAAGRWAGSTTCPSHPQPIALEPGDILLYYTDGLTEAENLQKDYFGEQRLIDLLRQGGRAGLSAQALLDQIDAAVGAFVGEAPPFDDLTMVIVRYTGE
jgi:hypothetical protein